jgi:hypothetical protein
MNLKKKHIHNEKKGSHILEAGNKMPEDSELNKENNKLNQRKFSFVICMSSNIKITINKSTAAVNPC